MFAIIENGGKQYMVRENTILYLEKFDAKEGDEITFSQVLALNDKIGTPYVEGCTVKGIVEKQGKQKKILVFKYKPKKNYHVEYGHRQPYTRVKITHIS